MMKSTVYLLGLIGLILVMSLGYAVQSDNKDVTNNLTKQSTPAQPSKQAKLTTIPVKIMKIPANRLLLGGTVTAHKSVVFTAQMPGRVVSIAGEEGDAFLNGSLLVKINDDELQAKRKAALAQFYSAASAVQNANVQFHRRINSSATSNQAPGGMGLPGMFDQLVTNPMAEVIGTRDYDAERGADIFSSRMGLDQAHHALEQARTQINQIDTKLRDTMSIAPFDGVIVNKNIEVGDTVQPGQTLIIYEDLKVLQLVVDVPGRLIHHIAKGQQLMAKVDGLDHEIPVVVSKIFPTSDPVRHTRRVKFNITDITSVAPGNYAEVWLPLSKEATKKRLIVPASVVIERGGIPSLFVVNGENRVELRLVRVGDILPSGNIEILYGVEEHERVLENPPSYITSGYKITN